MVVGLEQDVPTRRGDAVLDRTPAQADPEVADVVAAALRPSTADDELVELGARVRRLTDDHPLYPDLPAPTEAGR